MSKKLAEVFDEAVGLYKSGLTPKTISDRLGVSPSAIRKAMIANGVTLRTASEACAGRPATWAKGRPRGPMPDDHKRNLAISRKAYFDATAKGIGMGPNGYLMHTRGPNRGRAVHTVMVEERLGRRLMRGEAVHHFNGIKTDNRIENLVAMSCSDHQRLHRVFSHMIRKTSAIYARSLALGLRP